MNRRRNFFPFVAGLVLIAFSLACSLSEAATPPATVAPDATKPVVRPTQSVDVGQPTEPATIPAIPEKRLLTLEFPPKIRQGDSDIVRLTLEMDENGNITPTAQVNGNDVTGTPVEIPNLYDTHKVTAEARLDMAGMDVRPSEMISSPLLPGQSVTFYWSVRPGEVGIYRGTVWFFLKFVDKVSGEESEKAVAAQTVEIEAVNFFGFSANFTRMVGAVGSIIGGILGFPFLQDIIKYLWNRRRKK